MKNAVKKFLIVAGAVLAIAAIVFIRNRNRPEDYRDKYEGYDLTAGLSGLDREGTYTKYLEEHSGAALPSRDIEVDVPNYLTGTGAEPYGPDGQDGIFTDESSVVTWEVTVPESGFYSLYLEYLTVESRGVPVERTVYINGELPFTDASGITFSRLWTDGGPVRTDNQGNQIRPVQVERYDWQGAYFKDDMGYITEPFRFYFEKGRNTLTLEATDEPVIIRRLMLKPAAGVRDYNTYLAEVQGSVQPAGNASGQGSEPAQISGQTSAGLEYLQVIQGEVSTLRSDSSLYAKYDRSSPTTQPNSVTATVLNYIGGEVWGSAGQWIEWEFEVPEDGFYHITIKGRQNYARGSVSARSLYLDGEIPFQEAGNLQFDYSNDWKLLTAGDESGTPYLFYLTAGGHTIRLEAALGGMGSILEELEDSTFRLNQIYRRLLIYIGATPDQYRDYNIHQVYPEIIDAMDLESRRLYKIVDEAVAYTGQKADKIAAAQTLAKQLETFVKHPEKISESFTNFKDNITSLGTAILNMSETKLDIDYLVVSGTQARVPEDKAGLPARIFHEIKSFAATFFVDYDSVGDVYEENDEDIVKVWIVTGRDQGTILKSMVDDTFTPETGIKINVEIVDPGALLNAVVAGRGPNVVLSLGSDQPVNYALRHSVEDLTQFEGWQEVFERFYPSAWRAYEFEGGIYAVPETQGYNVMFYRKDILNEMELAVPNTWEELIEMLPTIQGNNLSVGIPSPSNTTGTTPASADLLYTLIYQNGSDIYDDSGMYTIIDNEAGVKAFTDYTKYFTDYGMPTVYDFVSRFRSGEMPLGIAPFSTFNTLMVSAPEIKGLWDFTLIPGTLRTDQTGEEYIDRSVYSNGTCTMMIKTDSDAMKENAWEFMKWWSGTDTQVRFGREQEALLGSSARYATANVEAFRQLSWSAGELAVLAEQWEWAVGFREVAGGYYTARHIVNASRKVMAENEDPRETIMDYAITIDEELTKKRIEFGLPVEE